MHRIRLRGPWTCQWATGGPPLKYQAPDGLAAALEQLARRDGVSAPQSREVILERPFHRPTGLDDAHDVRLEIRAGQALDLMLNGQSLGTTTVGTWQASVLDRLKLRNLLQIRLPLKEVSREVRIDEVCLVIDDA